MEHSLCYTINPGVLNPSNNVAASYNSSDSKSAYGNGNRNSSISSHDSGYDSSMSNHRGRSRNGSFAGQVSPGRNDSNASSSSSGSNGSNGSNGSHGHSHAVQNYQHHKYGNSPHGTALLGNPGSANTGNGNHAAAAKAAANMRATSWASSNEWEKYREVITRLYRDQGLHLKRVRSLMESEFNFHASERMYKTRISKWNLDKNLKAADVITIHLMHHQRALMGKKSEFYVRGRLMDYARVEQYIRRDPSILSRIQNNDDLSDIPTDHAQSAGIICRTPSPSPPPRARTKMSGQHSSHQHGSAAFSPPQQHSQNAKNAQNSYHHPHYHAHATAHHPHHTRRISGAGVPVVPVVPSQAALHPQTAFQQQMQLPVATSTMTGYPAMTTTSGTSPSSYTGGIGSSSSPFSSFTATAGVSTTSPFNIPATMGDSSSGGFNSLSAASSYSSNAYEFSAPVTFGTSAQTQGLTTAASPTSLGMMPTQISTPRTVTDPRFGSHASFSAPMPYSNHQAVHGRESNGQMHYVPQHAQHSQGNQQGSLNGIAAAAGTQYAPYGSAQNGVGPTHGSSSASANGHGGNPSLTDSYVWNTLSNSTPSWGGQFD